MDHEESGDDLLTGWKEIANYLHVSTKTIHRLKSHGLPFVRRGGTFFSRKSAIDAWINGMLEKVVLKGNRVVAIGESKRIIWSYPFRALFHEETAVESAWRVQPIQFGGCFILGSPVAVGSYCSRWLDHRSSLIAVLILNDHFAPS
jgi:excisionase family DNA binding protein